jgi:hypothetical protein
MGLLGGTILVLLRMADIVLAGDNDLLDGCGVPTWTVETLRRSLSARPKRCTDQAGSSSADRRSTMQAMTDGFSEGQRVYVETGGKRVEEVFVRPGDPDDAITVESPVVVGPYKRDVAWVRRSDTEAIEPFMYPLRPAA